MTYHIFKEENVVPHTRTINIRNVVDSSGPHLVAFGNRTTVGDGAATGTHLMRFRYEDVGGGIHQIETTPILLQTTDQIGGGIWYQDQFLSVDQYWPLGNGPYVENPLGICALEMVLNGAVGASRITYELIFQTFDGSPSVVMHP